MSSNFDSYQKRRLQSSYFSVIISISLVLFLLGVLGLVLLKSNKVANHFKEKVAITLFLKDNISKKNTEDLRASLQKEEFTKFIVYITKEDAALTYSKDLGEDFLEFLGENPLKNGIDIYLKADYVTAEKMAEIETRFQKNAFIADVSYDKPLINILEKNSKRMSFWLLVISSFFALIAILLINSSIRLSIYSKRFNIKTMQMVGATKSFIRRPFLIQSIKLGVIGAFISFIGLAAIIIYVDEYIPELELLKDYLTLTYLFGGVLFFAFFITWLSTFLATRRFLNLQTNDLYY